MITVLLSLMIYKIFSDEDEFLSFHIDMEEFLDAQDLHIGEVAAMQFSLQNIAMASHWVPLTLGLL
ncbi:hypothetical protein [Teredinibacter haidensis]|uniref:hypothetical protein n=1 Tax=Teredinibacter haidensis TaxID=2731755 RepID=UPI000B08C396|nr:hypothetical protein [Teredinibacter haidensis]